VDPLAERGFGAAREYERGRPSYAPAAIRGLATALGLSGSSRLLDLAAGTGQLSRLVVGSVGSVVAVEPSEAMRRELARRAPGVDVLAGTAERLPLPDTSVDAVVVGEAFTGSPTYADVRISRLMPTSVLCRRGAWIVVEVEADGAAARHNAASSSGLLGLGAEAA
jgi:SAM-dependent methyltransferase